MSKKEKIVKMLDVVDEKVLDVVYTILMQDFQAKYVAEFSFDEMFHMLAEK